jgi:glutamate-1-semialdehyde 2,1-aminomutase
MTRATAKSQADFERACRVLVGGVNSPVRAFHAVGGTPLFIADAHGCHLTDVDGNRYVDYVCGFGPAILGHSHPRVVEAVAQSASHGLCYGAPNEAEVLLAERVTAALPSVERVRFVSSGTEAVMTALRLARGYTGRRGIVKCIGCYHGHSDAMLVSAGSGAMTQGVPSSPGVPEGATAHTLLVPYNSLDATEAALEENSGEVAAVILEPVAGNMGLVPPLPDYLAGVRELCDRHKALLIFDEVITGFRLSPGGAQELFGVRPDLTTLGKIVGGGMPIGAVGGREEIMKMLAPEGPVYQAGTLAGNPVAMAAGLATLAELAEEGFYDRLDARAGLLAEGLQSAIEKAGLEGAVTLNRIGSMLTLFFAPPPVFDYDTAVVSKTEAFAAFFRSMLAAGIYLPPSQFETWFVSSAHEPEDLEATAAAAESALHAAASFV